MKTSKTTTLAMPEASMHDSFWQRMIARLSTPARKESNSYASAAKLRANHKTAKGVKWNIGVGLHDISW